MMTRTEMKDDFETNDLKQTKKKLAVLPFCPKYFLI